MTALAPFAFATAAQIRFGRGALAAALPEVARLGRQGFLVHGASGRFLDQLLLPLMKADVQLTCHPCPREPDLAMLEAAVLAARNSGADFVIALGGGAAIDLGKAVAALLPAPGGAMDHLEVVGKGLPLQAAPLPFVAIPTTSGTGAEVTKNAVIGLPEHGRKVSLRDLRMLADLAIVDPSLTDHSPRAVTLASGLDAVTQVIEPYLCNRTNPIVDALCRMAIPHGLTALETLMREESAQARDDLALCSLMGGLALANAGLGAVHGLAGVIGGLCPAAPHGAVCGALLPHVLIANRAACHHLPETLDRMDQIEDMLQANLLHRRLTLAEWISQQGLPGLAEMGVAPARHSAIAKAAQSASSMQANPVRLRLETLVDILDRAS